MKIVIALLEHIGDIVACEPVARYLRYKYPQAHISWVVNEKFRVLIDNNPYIDETVVVDCITDWIKMAGHGKFDLVADLHVNYRVCGHCGVPLVKKHGHPFVSAYEWFDYGALLEAFSTGAGLPPLSAQPRVYLPNDATDDIDDLGLPRDYVVVHRKSNLDMKDWSDESWREIVSYIRDELGLPVVEVGVGYEAVDSKVIDLIGKTSLMRTGAVIRGARFFVGVDSGPAHFANALQTPGVILLGRHAAFRRYNPYTGFYARVDPLVKIVRNLLGNVIDIPVKQVREAIGYVHEAALLPRSQVFETPAVRSSTANAADRSEIAASGLFDVAWYRLHTPEAAEFSFDAALDHFIATNGLALQKQMPDFDCKWYLEHNRDVAEAGIHPLIHYIQTRERPRRHWKIYENGAGWVVGEEGDGGALPVPRLTGRNGLATVESNRAPPQLSAFNQLFESDEIANALGGQVTPKDEAEFPKVFAFYLPQFHPIEENDWAHGLGFTEWHNVVAAKPLFSGHYQPRIPGELGFYDLRSRDVLDRQIELARAHGVDGFCFYYYYFAGKKILYEPIRNYIESDHKAPFFFLWANENWTKRWDGGDRDVIITQEHSDFDDTYFIRDLIETFQDERYVKIDGKPVLMIYKAHLFKDVFATTGSWRDEILLHGFPGLYLVMVDDWGERVEHPRNYGFDASYEIPSNITPHEVEVAADQAPDIIDKDFSGRLIDYQKFSAFHAGRPAPEHRRFRTVMAPWDNTPRYGSAAIVHVNVEGDGYKNWLSQALLDSYRLFPPQERIVFIHSWNEWCEGTYIEPDARQGRRLLQETKQVVDVIRSAIVADRRRQAGADIWALFNRALAIKDEGAFRALHVARLEAHYAWQDLQRVRAASPGGTFRTLGFEQGAIGALADPYERKLLERSLNLAITMAKFKRLLLFPLARSARRQKDKIVRLRTLRRALRVG